MTRRGLLGLAIGSAILIGGTAAGAPEGAETALEIEIQRGPGLPAERYVLTCDPPGGTVPDPTGACQRLAEAAAQPPEGRVLPPGPAPQRPMVCAQIYGGPDVARLRGRVRGTPVHVRLTRRDACAISQFDATMRLLGLP